MHIFDDLEIINFNHYQGLTLEAEDHGKGQLILRHPNGEQRVIAEFDKFDKAQDAFYDFCDALTDGKLTWDVHDFQVNRSLSVEASPSEVWTAESFEALVDEESSKLKELYEDRYNAGEVYKYGAELMNFIQEQGWRFTIQFTVKHIFLFSGDKRLFGINLFSNRPRFTFCNISSVETLRDLAPDYGFTFYPQYSQFVCHRGPTVQDLQPVFEFVYNNRLSMSGRHA